MEGGAAPRGRFLALLLRFPGPVSHTHTPPVRRYRGSRGRGGGSSDGNFYPCACEVGRGAGEGVSVCAPPSSPGGRERERGRGAGCRGMCGPPGVPERPPAASQPGARVYSRRARRGDTSRRAGRFKSTMKWSLFNPVLSSLGKCSNTARFQRGLLMRGACQADQLQSP